MNCYCISCPSRAGGSKFVLVLAVGEHQAVEKLRYWMRETGFSFSYPESEWSITEIADSHDVESGVLYSGHGPTF